MFRPRRLVLALLCALAVGVPAADAFTIGLGPALLGSLFEPHGGSAIHESITADAVRAGLPAAPARLVLGLQRGAENADITHQFDSETHFDNSSLSLDGGKAVAGRTPNFAGAFTTAHQRFAAAVELARGNPQFLAPGFKSFADIVAGARATFAKLAVYPSCVARPSCPTTFFTAEAARLAVWAAPLALNPDPDPHQPTGENSPFQRHCAARAPKMCGVLGGVNKYYSDMMPTLRSDLDRALRVLTAIYGANDPDTINVRRYRQDLDAYLAYQLLGHAFHSTEDFFAHSNYVELMSGVAPARSIAASKPGLKPADIAVPDRWADFSIAGVSNLLGPQAKQLETGAVGAIWLNDGDFCKSSTDVFFNPVFFKLKYPEVVFAPWPKIRWVAFPGISAGSNPNAPSPFRFCHYPTTTTVGLNKDEAKAEKDTARSSHVNFPYAKAAATAMASVLWCDFLKAIGSPCREAAAPAGGSGSGFGTPVAISPKGVTGRYPAVGVDGSGNVTVVWTHIGSGHDLRYAVRAKGAWSDPVAIPGSASFAPENAILSVSPSGNAVVAADGNRIVVALRRGGAFGAMTALTAKGVGTDQAAAMSDSGRALVAWRTDEGQIQVAIAEPGAGFGKPVTMPSGGSEAADPSVGIDSAGNAILAWAIAGEDGDAAILYSLIPKGQSPGAPRTLGHAAGAHGLDTLPSLDVTPGGKASLSWDDTDDCDDCVWIFMVRGATGTTTAGFGSPFAVSTARDVADGGKAYLNASTAGAGGPAGFVWEEASDADDRIGFRSGTGGSLGGYQHVAANPGQLRAAALRDRLLVAWVEQTSSGERARVASSTGGALDVELSSAWPSIGGMSFAANRAGAAAVVWSANDDSDVRVYVSSAGS